MLAGNLYEGLRGGGNIRKMLQKCLSTGGTALVWGKIEIFLCEWCIELFIILPIFLPSSHQTVVCFFPVGLSSFIRHFLQVLCGLKFLLSPGLGSYFTYFSTVFPSNSCVYLSCRPFVINTAFTTGLVCVEVSSVLWLRQLFILTIFPPSFHSTVVYFFPVGLSSLIHF